MATWNVETIEALQAVSPSSGDDAIVAGYFDAGDLGGRIFYWEGTSALPASAAITGVTAVSAEITALTPTAPVQATTASTDTFWTGQVIAITGTATTFTGVAAGRFTITVPNPSTPYIFTLNGTSGSGTYTSGSFTANTATIATSAAHGLVSGQQVMIGNVKGTSAVHGTWKATMISGPASATQFSIGAAASGTYTAHTGIIGDGGTTIPENQTTSPTNSRWRRISSEGLSVKSLGADNAAAMLAAANAATTGALSASITVGGSGYSSSPSVTFSPPQSLNGIPATGTASVTGGAVTSVRSLLRGLGTRHRRRSRFPAEKGSVRPRSPICRAAAAFSSRLTATASSLR
jgi:hypothetical protein